MKEYLCHLRQVLEALSKISCMLCFLSANLGVMEVDYFEYLVTAKGVRVDPTKVETMLDWPKPTNTKPLRGFIRLTRYYRKFIKNYGLIVAPITALIRKNCLYVD